MEEKKRKFTGIWIPKEVYLDERLSALEKIILVEIDSLDGEDGCFASNEYLAKFCQCSKNKISSAISKLVELNYLEVISFDGRKRFLKSCLTNNGKLPKNVSVPPKKCEAESQKIGHSNINNNITNKTTNTNVLVEAKPKTYGNQNINNLFNKWEEIFGYKQKDSKQNRYAASNMLRAKDKGEQWLIQTMTLLYEAQKDKYAGNYILGISNFADLQQRYDAVWKWGATRYARNQDANESIDI